MSWTLVLWGCAVTALATSLGAIPALILRFLSQRSQNLLLGFSAGIMLAATSFSLIQPSLELSIEFYSSEVVGSTLTGLSMLVGALFLFLCNQYIPHEHFTSGREGGFSGVELKRIWLFVFAIALHNLPEGLAVGSGVGSHDFKLAIPIMVGIGLQDLPEGFIVAAALLSVGYSKAESIGVAVVTGILEALAAVVGFLITSIVATLLPFALAFAGGAMLYVVVDEMVPEMKLRGPMGEASAGLLFGYVLMMIMDISL